jgi:two-component system CheB/CheR fusion protein
MQKRSSARQQPKKTPPEKKGKQPARTSPDVAAHAEMRVVGIGASAGGLDAFRELLQNLSTDSGMAFVIVQHLSRAQKSLLPDILSRSTEMPVRELETALPVEANHVYVMSPERDVEYSRGDLVVREREPGKHMPVDRLFTSLAEGLGELAVGVILSGTDGDGSSGAQQIKAVGGVTFAQDASAQFDGMPHSAIEKGVVDFVLSPKEIALKLVELSGRPALPLSEAAALSPDEFDRVISLLNASDRLDFLHCKTPTIERRIQRRMLLRNIDDLAVYRRQLEEDPVEREALYRDVLIGVTRFFRDSARVAALKETVFPTLFAQTASEALRIWVPACSTGEEVYSLAILLVEYMEEKQLARAIQIFGSDVNNESVAFARAGIYPPSIENAVSQERLRKFFSPAAGGGHSIVRSIRELCVFAEHNLLKDPPFSRLDFISCSNLLIYLRPAQQERVAAIFRYALNGDGLVMLGQSESLRASADGFLAVDKKNKIYRLAPGPKPRLDLAMRSSSRKREESGPMVSSATSVKPSDERAQAVDRLLLDRYAHPSFVVNEAGDVMEFRGDVQPFLAPTEGPPSFKLSRLIHKDLLLDVRTALFKAKHRGESVRSERLKMSRGDHDQLVNIEVLPLQRPGGETFYVIALERVAQLSAEGGEPQTGNDERLQQELAAARDYLTHLSNEHEQSDSVLTTTAEELQSANEELQSTVEELETAKEELQSTNEELSTLNDELRVRNADLVILGDDLMNLLSSIDTPVIMVDREQVIRLFNPTAERIFSFKQSDVGRPIGAFKPLMELPDLYDVIRQVIETPTTIDTDVRSSAGHWYSLRVRPYRSSRNQIEGAVITLIDTHDLHTALSTAEESRDQAEGARKASEYAQAEAIEANRLKDEFLSTLSHELRTPMTSILGWAQMMRMVTLDERTMSTAIATIERGTFAQIRLIDDLLDVSRITSGRLKLERRSFRLRALIEETLDVVRPALEARAIKVRTDLEGTPATIYADPDRLRQVIWNLLSNAVKFTPAEGEIDLSVTQVGGTAIISVRDTGEGISSTFLPRVFDRFSQSESGTKRGKAGLGLGLAISKYLVDLHGGSIVAESRGVGLGSTFTVRLPIPAVATEEPSYASSSTVTELPHLDGTTILVVDDDADSLRLVSVALRQCGAAVIEAPSVKEAMTALEASTPDVIISDIAMPGEDGLDLIRQIRMLPDSVRDAPIIALTAFTSEEDRRRILAAGFNEFITKPVAPLQLMRAVAMVGRSLP